ncbi:hypothetical protein CN238_04635 [Sinorhizobium meliloti]|nr:hypothetical protein CN238_04635 [Sinorhizobium meliloti]
METSISGASAAPLLTDMAGFKHLEGALKTEFDVTGAGGTTRTYPNHCREPPRRIFGWSHP